MLPLLRQPQRRARLVEAIGGLLLIGVGAALPLGQISQLSASLTSVPFELEYVLLGNAALSVPVAAAAGLLSFLSPCVLPLVPAYIGFISGDTHGERKESRPAAAATGTLSAASPSKTYSSSKGTLANDALSCEICPSSSAAPTPINSRPLIASTSRARL